MKNVAIGAALLILCISTPAQVVKCVGANGKITYSDVACPSSAISAEVNVSGGNITQAQVRQSHGRKLSENAEATNEACPALMNRAQQAFSRYQELRNINSSDASLRTLQNLGSFCPTSETCDLIKRCAQDAQQRHVEVRNKNASSALDASLGLVAKYCQGGGRQQPRNMQASADDAQASILSTKKPSGYETKDKFGTIVNSETCHWTKDAHGNDVRSASCSR